LDQQKRNTEELNTTVKYRFVYNFIAKDVFLTVALFFTNSRYTIICVETWKRYMLRSPLIVMVKQYNTLTDFTLAQLKETEKSIIDC